MWMQFSVYGQILAYKNVTTGGENINLQTQPNSTFTFHIVYLFLLICKKWREPSKQIVNKMDVFVVKLYGPIEPA